MEGNMTITTVIVISVISTLATIALLIFAIKGYWQRRWQMFYNVKHLYHGSRSKHRWHAQTQSTAGPLEFVEGILQLTPEQLTVWNPLKKEIIEHKQDLAEYREILTAASDMEQTVNRLEDFVNDSLIVLRKLKPKLTEFYRSLSSQQQHKVNALLNARAGGGNRYCGYRCGTA
jgi:hypothetical protein